jgi:hypothetical protein
MIIVGRFVYIFTFQQMVAVRLGRRKIKERTQPKEPALSKVEGLRLPVNILMKSLLFFLRPISIFIMMPVAGPGL